MGVRVADVVAGIVEVVPAADGAPPAPATEASGAPRVGATTHVPRVAPAGPPTEVIAPVAVGAFVDDVATGAFGVDAGTPPAAIEPRTRRSARSTLALALDDPRDDATAELDLGAVRRSGYSRRTMHVLVGIGVATLLVAIALVSRIVTAQGIAAEGREDAAALTAALETAEVSAAELATALEPAAVVESDVRSLVETVRERTGDLAPAAVDGLVLAADALTAALAEPAPTPTVAESAGPPATLADRYVATDDSGRAALRDAVAVEIQRLEALARTSAARIDEVAGLLAAAHEATAVTVRAGIAAAPATIAANPESTAEVRASFDAAVAAMSALGEAPTADQTTRQALSTYLSAADALRWSHAEAVRTREAAERAAAEQAAAEAAERAAEEARQRENPGWPWWGDDGPDWPGRDR